MGLLDFLWQGQGQGGGLLPQQPPQPQATPPGQPTFMSGLVDYFRNNPATISALAAGIGGAPSMRQGIAQAAGGMPQAMGLDQQRQGQQALGQYFKDPSNAQGLTPGQMQLLSKYPALAEKYALQSLVPQTSPDINEYKFYVQQETTAGRTPVTFKEWQTTIKGATGAQESYYGTPSQIVDKDRNVIALMIYSNRGNVKYLSLDGKTQLSGPPSGAAGVIPTTPGVADNPQVAGASPGGQFPAGSEIAPRGSVKLGDTGTSLIPVSPTGGVVGAPIPKNPQGAATATAVGTAEGGRIAALPRLTQQTQQAVDTLEQLKNDPVLPFRTGGIGIGPMNTGIPKSFLPSMAGTPGVKFDSTYHQVKSQAFLSAFESLRGGGQISNVEGEKATAAINKLDTAMSEKDFRDTIDEAEHYLQLGLDRARRKVTVDANGVEHPLEGADVPYQPLTPNPQQGGGRAPAVGAVEQGYRYVGGDPSSPNSWVKVQ